MNSNRTITALLALFLAAGAAAQQGTLHDDEARLSEALRSRAQAALDARFGPGRAVVEIRASLGLTPEARQWLSRAFRPPAADAPAEPERKGYSWAWLGGVSPDEKEFVLPGYPDEKKRQQEAAAPKPKEQPAPMPDAGLLRGFGTEVVSLRGRLTLDALLPSEADEQARETVRAAVGLEDSRGDTLTVDRAAKPDPWKELLRRPETVLQTAFRAVVILTVLIALWALLSAVTGARDGLVTAADKLAGALRRSSEKTLDLKIGGSAALERLGGGGGPPVTYLPPGKGGAAGPDGGGGGAEEEAAQEVIFDIDIEDAPKLYHLLKEQAPENVALVLPYLRPELRDAFLALMPRERTADVLRVMIPVRYVDPELLRSLRTELERRVEGVVGGIEEAVKFLQSLPSMRRGELLRMVREKDPEAAATLRDRVLLMDDLERLERADLTTLIGETPLEDLAAAAGGLPESFASAIVEVLPRQTSVLYKEMVQLGGAALIERGPAARESLLRRAEVLISEGRIKRPPASGVRVGIETKR